jgi:nucleoid-associated protein YgaU
MPDTTESIELRDNNPYSIGSLFTFDDGTLYLDEGELNYEKSDNDRYYTVIQGDTLWAIAGFAYQDSKEWWKIAMVNKLENPFELRIGSTLIIPDLENLKITSQ